MFKPAITSLEKNKSINGDGGVISVNEGEIGLSFNSKRMH
jgi:hypothetical protein